MTKVKTPYPKTAFFDRDLSWLKFNERVLQESERTTVPLMERIRFLSIYSSNLDEFYRVRIPSLQALARISSTEESTNIHSILHEIGNTVLRQQEQFGKIISQQILPLLSQNGIQLIYNEPIPPSLHKPLREYFMNTVASYIQVIRIEKGNDFFPENNRLYLVVEVEAVDHPSSYFIVPVPSGNLSRFFLLQRDNKTVILFLDDIIRLNLPVFFGQHTKIEAWSVKITRDAELNLEDEYAGNLGKKIERKLRERDLGTASRVLYEAGINKNILQLLKKTLDLHTATLIEGGRYHNLKDLSTLPIADLKFNYPRWQQAAFHLPEQTTLFGEIEQRDILLHPPYHSYETVIRFFNEASLDPAVKTIYVTLYRIASDSRIANALISASKNGKKVIVFVELKARFDEANNINWSKKMKASGVKIIESIPGLKVHAKLALARRKGTGKKLIGLMSTGNFNEVTARFYTDHVLMTSNQQMLREVEMLFRFIKKRKKLPDKKNSFNHLLVAQFNLQESLLALIDNEIYNVGEGNSAEIILKLNNLEEKVLISKLYDASRAGVKISLIVRGICCLVPGLKGVSENITVIRIVDRYLEHGRIFLFSNNGNTKLYIGSADWMNRNIYRRIEVCFPITDDKLITEMKELVSLQLSDNVQAVPINERGENIGCDTEIGQEPIRSQWEISRFLQNTVMENVIAGQESL